MLSVWLRYPIDTSWPMCKSKSPPRVVSTKAPVVAGVQMISSLTSFLICSSTGYPLSLRLGEGRIGIGAEQHRIGSVDTDETELGQCLGDGVRILAHVGWQCHARIAGSLADANDACRRVALENSSVLGMGNLLRGVLCGLPVGIVCPAFHVVDLLAIQFERDAKLHQRLDIPLPREESVDGRRNRLEVPTDGGKADAARAAHVNDAPSGEMALERARRLLLDVRPRRIGNRGKLAMKIIHADFLL